ncbi:MAG: FtsX-like permease family protein [Actinomycetia bacterium]|nr:FtsX-like permease family protein [Actinomycetes bacterium]
MLRITLKGIRGHFIRFLLTTLAVLLGVSFVVASAVLRDGLKGTFNQLFDEIYSDVDVEVRGVVEFSESDFEAAPLFDESLLSEIESVDGVAETASGIGFTGIIPIDPDGDPLPLQGAPILALNWTDSQLSPVDLVDGSHPGRGQMVMDIDTIDRHSFVIGETYEVIFPNGPTSLELSGSLRFGDSNALVGAVLVAYDLDELRELTDTTGQLQTISVAAGEGVDPDALVERIQNVLPSNVEAVTGETVVQEGQDDFGQIIDIIGWFFTGFALVALLVAAFLITNIFHITIGQRLRELALLRAIGATTTQIRTSVLTEALTIGLVASLLGIGGGAAFAVAVRWLMNAAGFTLPSFSVIISVATVITAITIGMGVTLLASLMPAFQAGRVPPAAAVQEGFRVEGRPRARLILGAILTAIGVLLIANGLLGNVSGSGIAVALGFGSTLVFIGVTTLSPLFAAPVIRTIGAPLQKLPFLGVSGQLARQNSARSARSTAAAAGALMIGLALTVGASVFGESLKRTIKDILGEAISADYIAQPESFGSGGFGVGFAEQLRELDELDRVAAFRYGNIRVNGDVEGVMGTNLDQLDGMVDPGVIAGSLSDTGPGSVLIHEDEAETLAVGVGDEVTVEFASGAQAMLTVSAVYTEAQVLDSHKWVIDLALWDQHFALDSDLYVMARSAAGVDAETARAAIEGAASDFPQIKIEDRSEFIASSESSVDGMLIAINVMLLFAFLIAILGIMITMTLMVFERTREIGMLRAVGMTGNQVWSMVLWEAILIAVFGALLGTVLGLGFGWAAVSALPDSFISSFGIPWTLLPIYLVVAGIGGLFAGLFPAWRASRMNVLEAVGHL